MGVGFILENVKANEELSRQEKWTLGMVDVFKDAGPLESIFSKDRRMWLAADRVFI